MARKKRDDWPEIEQEWAAGQLSKAEIARRFNVSRPAMQRHMDKEGVEYGSLAGSVRLKVQAKLVEDPGGKGTGKGAGMNPGEAVENAAEEGANVIRMHRKDISQLRQIEEKFLAELGDDPTKLHVFQYQGEPVQVETGIAVTERISALRNLTSARAQRIALERQAYSLDEERRDDTGKRNLDGIPEQLADMFK